MKRYNITTLKTYEKNGETKKYYPQVGSMVRLDAKDDKPEGFILELNMFPDTKFYVFEEKPKDEPKPSSNIPPQAREDSDEEIPF